MALTGEEIRRRLREFAAAWGGYAGTERTSAAHDPQESNRLLLELNRAIAAGEIDYHPFGWLRDRGAATNEILSCQ